jgi:hypothetical protein
LLALYLHAFPYVAGVVITLRVLASRWLGEPSVAKVLVEVGAGLAGSLVAGLVAWVVAWVDAGVLEGLVAGLVGLFTEVLIFAFGGGEHFGPFSGFFLWLFCALIIGLIGGIGSGLFGGLLIVPITGIVAGLTSTSIGSFGLILTIGSGLAAGFVATVFVGLGGAVNSAIRLGVLGGLAAGIGAVSHGFGIQAIVGYLTAFGIVLVRAYYWPPFFFLTWPKPNGRLYYLCPAVWDSVLLLPYPRLASMLVAYATQDRNAAEEEIQRLISSYPAQRGPALKARTIIIAREAARIQRFAQLSELLSHLPQGERGYQRQTATLREVSLALVAVAVRAETDQNPALRPGQAAELCLRVNELRDQIAGFDEPLASEFLKAAAHWQKLAEALRTETRALAEQLPHAQVFRAGDKVADRNREAFVMRGSVIQELQQQLLLATGCPGVVLYGRRRVGKSSVIGNLDGFLPDKVHTAVISLQDPRAFASVSGFCGEVHSAVGRALTKVEKAAEVTESAAPQAAEGLIQFLERTNRVLARAKRRLIVALDEYEYLDTKIGEGVLPVDLLACLRESMQSHREIIWILAGSHEISELTHAEWTSYLVSARTIEVPMFTVEETRALLTDPLKHAPMRREIWETRPQFEPEFWGPGGIEAIHTEAGGWPHLVQLLAETLLDEVNKRSLANVDAALFQEGLDRALVRGHNVLYQLLNGECTIHGEWDYLAGFRRAETQPPPEDDAMHRSLRRRLLIDDSGGTWRLRVPLMQRWMQKRA